MGFNVSNPIANQSTTTYDVRTSSGSVTGQDGNVLIGAGNIRANTEQLGNQSLGQEVNGRRTIAISESDSMLADLQNQKKEQLDPNIQRINIALKTVDPNLPNLLAQITPENSAEANNALFNTAKDKINEAVKKGLITEPQATVAIGGIAIKLNEMQDAIQHQIAQEKATDPKKLKEQQELLLMLAQWRAELMEMQMRWQIQMMAMGQQLDGSESSSSPPPSVPDIVGSTTKMLKLGQQQEERTNNETINRNQQAVSQASGMDQAILAIKQKGTQRADLIRVTTQAANATIVADAAKAVRALTANIDPAKKKEAIASELAKFSKQYPDITVSQQSFEALVG